MGLVDAIPAMTIFALVVLSDLFDDGCDIFSPLTLSDLLATSQQAILLEELTFAGLPSQSADIAELCSAQAPGTVLVR